MARPNNEFLLAWSSLSGDDPSPGWQTISLAPAGSVEVRAGRRSPDNAEAILVCFPTASLARTEKLPEGQGFLVERVDLESPGQLRLALTRQAAGSVELFAAMVCDVVGAIDDAAASSVAEVKLLRVFIQRVVAWQRFMSRGSSPLGPEAELGLVGELVFLEHLLRAGISTETVLESWVGPDDAPQDFVLGDGAIEVKATLSTAGFPVKIGSLEQLDDSTVSPLFLGAIRFVRESGGRTLPEVISSVEHLLANDPTAVVLVRQKLLTAGYIASHAAAYTRTFEVKEVRTYRVTSDFPRLTAGAVPEGISRAIYEIDLERIKGFFSDLPSALRVLGVVK